MKTQCEHEGNGVLLECPRSYRQSTAFDTVSSFDNIGKLNDL